MSLLDKPFIIFIAREHDKQEERNTIRSERTTAGVSRHLSQIASTLIQGKAREVNNLTECLHVFSVDDSIIKVKRVSVVEFACMLLYAWVVLCG